VFHAESFEDAIRNAISVGGDSDTIACISGSLAELIFKIPPEIEFAALNYLDESLRAQIVKFKSYVKDDIYM